MIIRILILAHQRKYLILIIGLHKHKSWLDKQYILSCNNTYACVGAGHFFATYKRSVIGREPVKVNVGFVNGLEKEYFDMPTENAG